MAEEQEEKKSFTITDRRFSKRAEAEPAEEPGPRDEPAPPPERERPREGEASSEGTEYQPPDFSGFLVSLANSALISLGVVPDPLGGQAEVHLEGAKQMIDILGVLQVKTEGNLTDEESRLLKQILSELRLRFVEVARSHRGGTVVPPGG